MKLLNIAKLESESRMFRAVDRHVKSAVTNYDLEIQFLPNLQE